MPGRRTDRSGRTALVGCGLAAVLLFGLLVLGLTAYTGGIFAVRRSDGYRHAVSALRAQEATAPVLGLPLSDGWWLGLQLARDAAGHQELRVRARVRGSQAVGTLYTTLQDGPDGWAPTTVLLDVDGHVSDILADHAEALEADTHARRSTLLADARRRIDAGQLAEALPIVEEALRLDPDNAAAWATRAEVRLGLGDTKGAEADAREALVLDPDSGTGQRALAQVHQAYGDWRACIEVATVRIRSAPRDGRAWTIRAHCFLGAERPREALAGAREGCTRGDPRGCELARSLE